MSPSTVRQVEDSRVPAPPGGFVPFCKLADPSGYVACDWDFIADAVARVHWVEFFRRHYDTLLRQGVEVAVARGETLESATARADRCRTAFHARLDDFLARPDAYGKTYGRVTILTADAWRDGLLREHGFLDPFIDLKNRENQRVLPLLPAVCRELDALSGREQLRAVLEGVFAGNLFDMGVEATAKAFLNDRPDFFGTRGKLHPRPWLIDDFDALAARLLDGTVHRKAVVFVDNAGSDFVLGLVPLMRWLARRGTRVVLAANEWPTLNDMTIHDVAAWWPRIVETEPSLAGLPIEAVSTGTAEPLIDLSAVAPGLNQAAADADLILLEGMGRGVETNLDARFTCDAVNLAMLKLLVTAQRFGGKLYDLVCRFRPRATT